MARAASPAVARWSAMRALVATALAAAALARPVESQEVTAAQIDSIDKGGRHLVLKAPHPSPLSAHNGFFGCRHFSMANRFLESRGLPPIATIDTPLAIASRSSRHHTAIASAAASAAITTTRTRLFTRIA